MQPETQVLFGHLTGNTGIFWHVTGNTVVVFLTWNRKHSLFYLTCNRENIFILFGTTNINLMQTLNELKWKQV